MKKIGSVIGNVLIVLVLVFAISITVMTITSVKNDDRVPNLFGYAMMNVETDSMEADGGFYVGDIIFVRMIDKEEANHLSIGDVITFRRNVMNQQILETHRIVENNATVNAAFEEIQSQVTDGVYVHGGVHYYITRGDNTDGIDTNMETGEIEYSSRDNILGVWEGSRIPKLGAAMKFLRSQFGFMICIVIPVALFFIYELYVFIMTLTRKQKEKAIAEVADKEAELKAKAVAEFLAQQQTNGGGTTPPAEETKPADSVAEEKGAASAEDISEAEKQRIIQEYLAKQKDKE